MLAVSVQVMYFPVHAMLSWACGTRSCSKLQHSSFDFMPGYIITVQDKECLDIAKDTEREDELKSMSQAWEAEQPGRRKKVGSMDGHDPATSQDVLCFTGRGVQEQVP